MAFKYALRFPDGNDAGEAEYPDGSVQAGDEIRVDGNRMIGRAAWREVLGRGCQRRGVRIAAGPALATIAPR